MCGMNQLLQEGRKKLDRICYTIVRILSRKKKLIMYSDQCGDQNMNIKMALICDFIATSTEFTENEIDHKFLVSGHSYLPCDQDFGIVEKEKKFHKNIF